MCSDIAATIPSRPRPTSPISRVNLRIHRVFTSPPVGCDPKRLRALTLLCACACSAPPAIGPAGAPHAPPNIVLISLDACRGRPPRLLWVPPRHLTVHRFVGGSRHGFQERLRQHPRDCTVAYHHAHLVVPGDSRHQPDHPKTRRSRPRTGGRVDGSGGLTRPRIPDPWRHRRRVHGLGPGIRPRLRRARRPAGRIPTQTRRLVRLVERYSDVQQPLFLLLHTYETHSPYRAPPEYAELFDSSTSNFEPTTKNLLASVNTADRDLTADDIERLKALYDAEIRYTDDTLRALFSQLEDSGFLDNALVIITADHGEELAEHGGLLHRGLLYEELVHVPLIIWKSGSHGGAVDERLVSTIDITPTILAAAGVAAPAEMDGRSLALPGRDRSRQRTGTRCSCSTAICVTGSEPGNGS